MPASQFKHLRQNMAFYSITMNELSCPRLLLEGCLYQTEYAVYQTLHALFVRDLFFRLFRANNRCRCALWRPYIGEVLLFFTMPYFAKVASEQVNILVRHYVYRNTDRHTLNQTLRHTANSFGTARSFR